MTPKELKRKLDLHKKWLKNEDGERANLWGANLVGANLVGTDLREANLRGANLREANLCGANLCGANLCGANLCGAGIAVLYLGPWTAYVGIEDTRIGCQHRKNEEWLAFSDKEISKMHPDALDWWTLWRPIIQSTMENLARVGQA